MDDPRAYMRVYQGIRAQIDSGDLESGRRLNIGGLAEQYGTGRDTVQRALGMLAGEDRVQRWAGLGWYVA